MHCTNMVQPRAICTIYSWVYSRIRKDTLTPSQQPTAAGSSSSSNFTIYHYLMFAIGVTWPYILYTTVSIHK